jgi:hypothetical protein
MKCEICGDTEKIAFLPALVRYANGEIKETRAFLCPEHAAKAKKEALFTSSQSQPSDHQ